MKKTIAQASRDHSIPYQTLYAAARQGRLKSTVTGGVRFVTDAAVNRYKIKRAKQESK